LETDLYLEGTPEKGGKQKFPQKKKGGEKKQQEKKRTEWPPDKELSLSRKRENAKGREIFLLYQRRPDFPWEKER